jgi:hypothetical protein
LSRIYELNIGEKWVARYTNKDGSPGMGIGNHPTALPQMVNFILHSGGRNIVITDETCRPKIIEGKVEIVKEEGVKNEQSSEVHARTIGHSVTEKHE